MTGGGDDRAFLDRWSRRKQAAREAPEPEPAPAPEPAPPAEPGPDLDAMSDAELLSHFELPDPETLGKGDDFTPFLARTVPQRLKRLALRRLWRTNPIYSLVDGMDEYAEDYTAAALLTGPVNTSYQVGRGMRAHTEWLQRQAKAAGAECEPETPAGLAAGDPADRPPPAAEATEAEATEAEATETEATEAEVAETGDAESAAGPGAADGPAAAADAGNAQAAPARHPRRRMVFRSVEESGG